MESKQTNGEPLVILLVEDDPDHAEMIVRSLRDHRVANEIRHLPDGQEALDYLFRRGPYSEPDGMAYPHVILLDLRLPKVDGLEVLRIIKSDATLARIPVVILTSSDAETDIASAYNHHANSYLVKPIDFARFTQMMNDLGFYWLGWNRHPW
jgi:CheY-like chemotaxis protein